MMAPQEPFEVERRRVALCETKGPEIVLGQWYRLAGSNRETDVLCAFRRLSHSIPILQPLCSYQVQMRIGRLVWAT